MNNYEIEVGSSVNLRAPAADDRAYTVVNIIPDREGAFAELEGGGVLLARLEDLDLAE
ncbi:MAG: hypothetical protein WC997_17835 [Porticoccaceae bacterium]